MARKKFMQTLSIAQISAALRRPRAQHDVYKDYNVLRQRYILERAAKHYNLRDDDPAPLYGKTLLDVGCGESPIGQFLALSGADITAIDEDPTVLAAAESAAVSFGAPITFHNVGPEKLLNTSKFDIILALDVLEDSENAAKLVWVLKQILVPGGLIIFSHINRKPRSWFYHVFLSGYVYGRTPSRGRRFSRFHSPQLLDAMCRKVGLQLSDVQGLKFSIAKQCWLRSTSARTRYLAEATELPPQK
ncbi:MAG: 3-demethylubiquinone-9 3-O-methyltransferase [Pseudomonas fluorescens]|nr:MAG: 3-demethylubiquinone-9 3-O-methyltransferase [Pseudomonas fluorescens]